MTYESVRQLSLEALAPHLHNLGHHYPIHVSFSHQVGASLELVESAFFSLLFAEVIEDELKIFAGGAEDDLILAAVEFIVVDFDETIVDEDITINDIEHAAQFGVLVGGVVEPDWVEVVDATVLFDDEAAFDELAD